MKKILIVDDAPFILESTKALLQFEGYEVITAKDGQEGLDIIVKEKPDLILCDIAMPNIDGYTVLKTIKSNPSLARIPFIFLTAFTERQNIRTGMQLGADDFLVKPYSRDELISSIEAQMQKSSIQSQVIEEKLQEVNRSVTEVLPHEFRTVLNQIMGSAKFMQSNANRITPEEIIDLVNDIIDSTNRLLVITENYLIYSRIQYISENESEREKLTSFITPEPMAILYDTAGFIASRYQRISDLVINADIYDISIAIASESFHKIISELIDNAFKFSEQGSNIEISAEITDGKLIIHIKDNGRGIPKEKLDSIGALIQFERNIFEQQGVGLGLIVAKRLTELHKGEFTIESQEGIGTTITLSFPYKYL
jgi:CheY-like chemotaxis protein/anti-sigma regulatory factor (Ser/Thr protein kinase)